MTLSDLPVHMAGIDPAAERRAPAVPSAVGPLSRAVTRHLAGRDDSVQELAAAELGVPDADPYGLDLQLALYLCYELHYRGLRGVPAEMEWDPDLLRLRGRLEAAFLGALDADLAGGDDLADEVNALLAEPADATGMSHHLARAGTMTELREYIALRSLYHLKEGDPQAWVIPRLDGQAKAAVVTVEHDEYGAGRADRMHSRLFAAMMQELNLSTVYGAYLDAAPHVVLAEINLMSLCGLHRRLRGAAIGQFAVIELTSSPGSARLVAAARRLGAGPATERFYAEHVEADAVHEQVLRRGVLAPLVRHEPELATDIVFGIQASTFLGGRFADYVLSAWGRRDSALRTKAADGYRTCRDDG